MNILIAGASQQYNSRLQALLTGMGMGIKSTAVLSAQEAIDRLSGGDFDGLVSDVFLADMSGFELCKAIKSSPTLHDVPVMFYATAYSSNPDLDRESAEAIGAQGYVIQSDEQGLAAMLRAATVARAAKRALAEQQRADLRRRAGKLRDQVIVPIEDYYYPVDSAASTGDNYHELFERAPFAYFAVDDNDIVLDANHASTKLLGLGKSSLIGVPFEEFVTHSNRRLLQGHFAAVRETGGTLSCELAIFSATREKRCVHMESSMAVWDKGTRVCLVAVVDITDRKRREDDERFLSEANRRLAQSIDYETTLAQLARMCVPYLADWCTVFIVEGNSIHRLATAHHDPAKEAIGEELHRQFPITGGNAFAVSVLQGETVLIPEMTHDMLLATTVNDQHRDLVTRMGPTSIMIVPLKAHGRTLGALSLMATSTHPDFGPADLELATELANRAAMPVENARLYKEAQEAVKARDEFLSIASHELRTPLTSLTLQLQSLSKSIRENGLHNMAEERTQTRLLGAYEQTQRMTRLVDRLLDVSRISMGRIEIDLEEVDLATLTEEVIDRFDHEIKLGGYEVSLDVCVRPICIADRFRLDQIVTNLLSNALKYGRGNPINVTVDAHEGKAVLSVEDQGIGIAPEAQQRVFERFERAALGGSYTGMGLGLYISKRLVEAMHGSIELQSEADKGSAFRITLPLASEQTIGTES